MFFILIVKPMRTIGSLHCHLLRITAMLLNDEGLRCRYRLYFQMMDLVIPFLHCASLIRSQHTINSLSLPTLQPCPVQKKSEAPSKLLSQPASHPSLKCCCFSSKLSPLTSTAKTMIANQLLPPMIQSTPLMIPTQKPMFWTLPNSSSTISNPKEDEATQEQPRRELSPFPFFYYWDNCLDEDLDPLLPMTAAGRVPTFPITDLLNGCCFMSMFSY